jgi:pyrroline-5-carboxylate reductase
MLKRISIIGAGNLTQALLYSIDNSSLKMNINLYDKDKKKKVFASQKKWKFFTKVGKEISDSDIIIIAVKPNQYKNVCSDIKKEVIKETTIVSLMAGVKIRDLKSQLPSQSNVLRVMTNINAKYNNAISSLYFDKSFKKTRITPLKKFFSLFGGVRVLKKEADIDKATALIGSGPAYFIYFSESMIEIFQSFGFTKNESADLVSELFYGTALLCKQDSRSFAKIKKSVVSKGGTTEAALQKLDRLKTKKILMESIKDAYVKAKSLSRAK